MPVASHHGRNGAQRVHDQPRYVAEQLTGDLVATRALQVQLQVLHAPLAAVQRIVLALPLITDYYTPIRPQRHPGSSHTYTMLLYAHVGEVHVHVIQLRHAGVVLNRAKAAEAELELVRLQRPERRDQHVQAHIELLAADEERIVYVARYHVGLLADLRRKSIARLARPFLQLRQLVDQKDAGALRFAARLHDPRGQRILAILLDKHIVVGGQNERGGHEVKVQVLAADGAAGAGIVSLLGQLAAVALQVLAVTLDVFDQQILARQLVAVWKVVDHSAPRAKSHGR